MKRIIAIILSFALFTGLCACGQSADGQTGSGEQLTWQEQYDLGLRYLEEGDYEEAILAFTAAIEIDPKRAEAYVGRGDAYSGYAQTLTKDGTMNDAALEAYENAIKDYRSAIRRDKTDASVYQKAAEVYIILGDPDSAAELLEKGLRATEDQSLRDLLDELTNATTVEELTEGSSEWQAMEAFLSCFAWYGNYDCETAAVRDAVYEGAPPRNALEKLVTVASCYCYDDSLYPGEPLLIDWDHTDPLNKWDYMGSYGRASEAKMDWLLEHIFNCSPEDISSMKQPIMAGENEEIYYLNGHYYFFVGGIGGGFDAKVTRVEPMEDRYYVEYDLYDIYAEEPEKYCASMALKTIDGKEYWSLYYNREADGGGTPPAGGSLMEAYIGDWSGDADMYIEGVDVDHISCGVAFYRLCFFEFTGTIDLSGHVALYDEASDVRGELVLVDNQITLTLEDVPNFYFNDSLSEFLGGTQFVFYRS